MGLTEDSIHCYIIGDQRRAIGNALLPLLTPHQAVADGNQVRILIRGTQDTMLSCQDTIEHVILKSKYKTTFYSV